MIGTKCILQYLLKKPTNGEVQVCADAATAYSTALSIYIENTNSYNSSSVAAVRLNQCFDLKGKVPQPMVWYGNSDQVKWSDFPHLNMLVCYVVDLFFLPHPHVGGD